MAVLGLSEAPKAVLRAPGAAFGAVLGLSEAPKTVLRDPREPREGIKGPAGEPKQGFEPPRAFRIKRVRFDTERGRGRNDK